MRENLQQHCQALIDEAQNLKAALANAQFIPQGLETMLARMEERALADLRLLQTLLVLKP